MQQASIIVDVSYPLPIEELAEPSGSWILGFAISNNAQNFTVNGVFGEYNLGFEFPNNDCAENFKKQCREKGVKVWN